MSGMDSKNLQPCLGDSQKTKAKYANQGDLSRPADFDLPRYRDRNRQDEEISDPVEDTDGDERADSVPTDALDVGIVG